MTETKAKLNFNAIWSMAVSGMVGGGIFSTLGVVIGIAGAWAWLSFAVAGLIALAAGYSYVKLADHYGLLGVLVFIAVFGRLVLLNHVKTEQHNN